MKTNNLVKKIQDIMRNDAGINGDAQRIEQMSWLLFLKAYDSKEEEWEFYDNDYKSIIPEEYKWHNWAIDKKDGHALTGDKLLELVDGLFKTLKSLDINSSVPLKKRIVKYVFEDANNYMKDGVLLRQVINTINENVDFSDYRERHAFGEIYETILKDLQSAGNAGEFYTPRAVTDFMVEMINPKLGETVADFACGTGGFLTSTLKHLELARKNADDVGLYNRTVYGVEKKQMPYLLCITNMLIHDVDEPQIYHMNSLERDVRDYKESEKFDIILMNPPYGGSEKDNIKNNFPAPFRTSETANLFMIEILYRLKAFGRCAVVLPESFLVDKGNLATFKEELLKKCNLHTVVKMTDTVFAPYANVSTYLLFFNKGEETTKIWFYEHQYPIGLKAYSKTNPIKLSDFDPERKWWNKREEGDHCWSMSIEDVKRDGYSLQCNNPNKKTVIIEYNPEELSRSISSNIENLKNNFIELSEKIKDVSKYQNVTKIKIKDLFYFEKGTLQSSKCVPGEYNFITASEEWKTHNEYSHDCEALIFACAASGSLGRTHYVNGKFISSDLCYILTPKKKVDLLLYKYVFDFVKTDIVSKTATGSAKKAINAKNFGDYELPYFDYQDQIEIKRIVINIQKMIDATNSSNDSLNNLIKFIFNIKDVQ